MARVRGIKQPHPLGSVASRAGVQPLTAASGATTSSGGVKISALPAAGAANDSDQLEVNQSGTTRRITVDQIATQVIASYTPYDLSEFDVERFGLSVENADNLAALLAAMATVSAGGGGTMVFGPGTYAFSDEFFVPNGVSLRGVKGMTKFSFVSANHWTTNTGWIKAAGTFGTEFTLTRDLKRAPRNGAMLLITSTTRAGTVISAATDMPHGLVAGDLIWVQSAGAPTAGQAVFFTQNNSGTQTYFNRTTPRTVGTVADTTHFTYDCANTGDTTLTTTNAALYRAADVAVVASTAGLVAGQTVMLRSQAFRQNVSDTEHQKIGEFQKIARIISSTWVRLHSEVQDDYLVADTAKMVPCVLQQGFAVRNIEVVGRGPNSANVTYGDRGIWAVLCEDPEIVDCVFTDVDQMGVHIDNCIGGRVTGTSITSNAADEAGFSSGNLDIQYGIAYSGATTGLQITNSTIYGCRHAIVQSGSDGADRYGVARGITISGNTLYGAWTSAISSHQAVDSLVISGNTIMGSESGINIRFNRNVVITDNVITTFDNGIECAMVLDNLKIANNTIRTQGTGIYITTTAVSGNSPATNNEPYGPVTISGNTIIGSNRSIYVLQNTGRNDLRFDITGNTLMAPKWEAIRMNVGNSATATDGFTAKIDGNSLYDNGQATGGWASFFITNMRAGTISNNTWHGGTGTLTTAIFLDGEGTGDGTIWVMDNKIPVGLVTTATLTVNVDKQVLTNLFPRTAGTVVIAGGILKLRTLSGFQVVDTEAAAATDDLDTITATTVPIGHRLILRNVTSGRTVVVKHNTGNIRNRGAADKSLVSTDDKYECVWIGTRWEEI